MRLFIGIIFIGLFSMSGNAQEVEVIDVPELEILLKENTGKTRIINFWATWCGPCVEEMPYFEEVRKDPQFSDVEIILISVDFVEVLETKVKKFIKKKELGSTVKLIDNVDYNSWIYKVDPEWSGEIPATLIINTEKSKRSFHKGAFKKGDLQEILLNF